MMNFDRDKRGSYEEDAPKKTSFKEAFASARKGGEKTFEWNGKKYTTDVAKPKADAQKAAAPMEKPKAKYEAPVDRYARENRETAQSEESMSEYKPRRGRMVGDTEVDTNTLLPKKYAKGGSVSSRADGIASKGKTNCKMR
jgi:hypothetical protein